MNAPHSLTYYYTGNMNLNPENYIIEVHYQSSSMPVWVNTLSTIRYIQLTNQTCTVFYCEKQFECCAAYIRMVASLTEVKHMYILS